METSQRLPKHISEPPSLQRATALPRLLTGLRPRLALALLLLSLPTTGCKDSSAPPPKAQDANSAQNLESGQATQANPGAQNGASQSPADPTSTPPAQLPPDANTGLPDQAAERGLDYHNRSGSAAKPVILEANGAGVAMLDLQNDGDLDLVFSQGLSDFDDLAKAIAEGGGADIEVFHNDGAGNFKRAAQPAGLDGWWTGLAAGDIDNDGDTDLVVGGIGSVRVLLQDENGNLVPSAELAPEGERADSEAPLWATSLALFDGDRDGNLDLYVCSYLNLNPSDPVVNQVGSGELALPCRWKGQTIFCGPHGLEPQRDRVYQGAGDGNFSERKDWLPNHTSGFSLGVAAFDSDGDLDTDLFVAVDSTPNLLLINDGSGKLNDYAFGAGVALSQDGAAEAGMGIATGYVNRDGLVDLAVTNFSGEPTQMYFGSASGFSNETFRFGLNRASKQLLSWGAHFTDFDGDGWMELFTANGHVYPQADGEFTGTSYGQPDTLWFFGANRALFQVEPAANSVLAPEVGTRGAAVGDLSGDGAPDLVTVRIDAPAGLGVNQMGASNQRLELRLSGPKPSEEAADGFQTPMDAMGATAVLTMKNATGRPYNLQAQVNTAVGYQSSSSPYLHFGMGQNESFEALEIRWPSGEVTSLPGGKAGRRLWIQEDQGIFREEPLR